MSAKWMYLLFILSTFLACLGEDLSSSSSSSSCEDTNCADYRSRLDAQKDFEWNPDCRADLDADKDGVACEESNWTIYYNSLNTPPNSGGSGCPTTSNCGCSGKNKSPCESDSCCRWIVGNGCKCQ